MTAQGIAVPIVMSTLTRLAGKLLHKYLFIVTKSSIKLYASFLKAHMHNDMPKNIYRIFLLSVLLLSGCMTGGQHSSNIMPEHQQNTDNINSARIHTELAANYYSRKQHAIALEELDLALRSSPAYAPAYNMLGLVYMELKEDSKATQSFEQALKLAPNNADINNNYGWFLCQRGDVTKSFSYFMAAQRNPLYTTPDRSLVNAGICARKIKDLPAAENYFKQALGIQPAQLQALYYLADISFEQENYKETKAYLTRYFRFDNPSVEALWLAVRNERKLANRSAEADYASLLCKRFPESSECQMIKAGVRK